MDIIIFIYGTYMYGTIGYLTVLIVLGLEKEQLKSVCMVREVSNFIYYTDK
jgi:hypothetical protein